MKAELINHAEKGICILISDINPVQLLRSADIKVDNIPMQYMTFSDVKVIADAMREGMFIKAIKEVRAQTGWGLKEAKEFVEKYRIGQGEFRVDSFIQNHTMPVGDFLDDDEFNL